MTTLSPENLPQAVTPDFNRLEILVTSQRCGGTILKSSEPTMKPKTIYLVPCIPVCFHTMFGLLTMFPRLTYYGGP